VAPQSDVEREVERILAGSLPNVDLREVTVVGAGDEGMLRIVVDHPDGVDHELCVAVTRALDGSGLRDRFGLEVSSPGPEPPLRTVTHYADAIGLQVTVGVRGDEDRRTRSVSGVLTAVSDERITIMTPDGARDIAFQQIQRGRVVERSEG
jgi:ribosome maturation factor RimP